MQTQLDSEPFERIPSPDSLRVMRYALSRAGQAPIRHSMIAAADDKNSGSPPIARMLRGGRSGEVRLKLFVTLLWLMPQQPPHEIEARTASFAQLLDLKDAPTAGTRRIHAALKWLEAERFVVLKRRKGKAPTIHLLNENGNGRPYQHPKDEGRYFKIPPTFWAKRWIHDLSGAALAILLVILTEHYRSGPRLDVWVAPKIARERYGLSQDTWTKGTTELQRLGLIQIRPKLLSEHEFDIPKRRNEYRLARAPYPRTLRSPAYADVDAAVIATFDSRPYPQHLFETEPEPSADE